MTTRRGLLAAAPLAVAALQGQTAAAARIAVGSPVFLLGDEVLEDHWNLERQLVPPRRVHGEPLIRKEHDWEGMGPYLYGSVLRDPSAGLWKCWYTVFSNERYRARQPFPYRAAYATSRDGIVWNKPKLGLVDHKGSRQNNLVDIGVLDAEAVSVRLAPPGAKAPARYAGMTLDKHGVVIFLSDDGLAWRKPEASVVDAGHSDCHNSLCWDARRRRWLAYLRPPYFAGPGHDKRRIAVSESTDLRTWTRPVTVLRPDEADPPEFYAMPVFPRGNLLFGFLQVYDRRRESLEVELAYSADGYRWHRLPGHPTFLGTGAPGSFDSGMVTTADDTVIDGDRMYTYYGGWNGDHKSNLREAAISRVESPRDRFIGWRTHGPEPGFLLTRPMLAAGARVTVNASVRGQLAMAVCDDRGAALPGFAFDDCGPVHGDGFAHAVSWKGDWRTLNGRAVRLRVRVRDGAFYSLTFA